MGSSVATVVAVWRAWIAEWRMQLEVLEHVKELQTRKIVIYDYWPFETECDPLELLLTLEPRDDEHVQEIEEVVTNFGDESSSEDED
ncbi:unnamed protein product [Callosobruchus maculatus]|uniref:Uncharacterized protein n=1 Tax=Callosobruchus maculatus TaxID=64391 RepID=A0A653C6Z7_CALMS|nr:unnamed protein product [Callosobruchus maculatus]